MSAVLIVRAEITDPADRDAFDRWYQQEHLPQASDAFGVRRSWRGWSDQAPAAHLACYEFDDAAAARAVIDSEAMARMRQAFDEKWGERVSRSREIVEIRQER